MVGWGGERENKKEPRMTTKRKRQVLLLLLATFGIHSCALTRILFSPSTVIWMENCINKKCEDVRMEMHLFPALMANRFFFSTKWLRGGGGKEERKKIPSFYRDGEIGNL